MYTSAYKINISMIILRFVRRIDSNVSSSSSWFQGFLPFSFFFKTCFSICSKGKKKKKTTLCDEWQKSSLIYSKKYFLENWYWATFAIYKIYWPAFFSARFHEHLFWKIKKVFCASIALYTFENCGIEIKLLWLIKLK